jgi:hypothetical protein
MKWKTEKWIKELKVEKDLVGYKCEFTWNKRKYQAKIFPCTRKYCKFTIHAYSNKMNDWYLAWREDYDSSYLSYLGLIRGILNSMTGTNEVEN